MSFKNDIEGMDFQLYPVVQINGIWYSTNNVTIDDNYCKPILMSFPTIKESIDIESKNYRISYVSLEFNNFVFDGVRFSDQLSGSVSLMNTEAVIYYKSNTELKEVFRGVVRKLIHDNKSVKIEVEDYTAKKTHRDLPQAFIGDSAGVFEKYRNRPIPMVYGKVDKSPVVVGSGFINFHTDYRLIKGFVDSSTTFEHKHNMDSDSNPEIIKLDPLLIESGDGFYHVQQENQYNYGNTNHPVISMLSFGSSLPQEGTTAFGEVYLICRKIANPKFSVTNTAHDSSLQNEDFLLGQLSTQTIEAVTDGSNQNNYVHFYGERQEFSDDVAGTTGVNETSDVVGYESLLLSWNFDVTPSHDTLNDDGNAIIGFQINHRNFPKYIRTMTFKSNHINQMWGRSGDTHAVSGQYDDIYKLIYSDDMEHFVNFYNVFKMKHDTDDSNLYNPDQYPAALEVEYWQNPPTQNSVGGNLDMPIILFVGEPLASDPNNTYNNFKIEFRVISDFTWRQGHWHSPRVDIRGNLNEVGFLVENKATKIFNKDYYVNIEGRISEDDTIPELSDGELIQNPIDIIYDLVSREMGYENINYDEYIEARQAHQWVDAGGVTQDWKFAFSVSESVNSKKLIEDIAKSTRSFPRFKKDGSFGFDTFKKLYTDQDYLDAHTIIESEVISYKFKKTDLDKIYRKMEVHYYKDYAEGTYLNKTEPYDLGSSPLYGIEDSNDAFLKFESDYIRDEETAIQLREFLKIRHSTDHLVINVELPVKYIDVDVGDSIKFPKLLNGIKPYGINYTVPMQSLPLFMVTSISKKSNSISLEAIQLKAQAGANFMPADEEIDEGLEAPEVIVPQAPDITIDYYFKDVPIYENFDVPTASAWDEEDGSIEISGPVITPMENIEILYTGGVNVDPETGASTGTPEYGQARGVAYGDVYFTWFAIDSDGMQSNRTSVIHIIPRDHDLNSTELLGYYSWSMNAPHYRPPANYWENFNLRNSGMDNAFWFFFEADNHSTPHGMRPIFFDDNADELDMYHDVSDPYASFSGTAGFRKVVNVTGLPNPNDNGLYWFAWRWHDPESPMDEYDYEDLPAFGGQGFLQGAGWNGYYLGFPNHWIVFQKIKMKKNRWSIYQEEVIDEGMVTSFGESELQSNTIGETWLSDPEPDDNHVISSDMFNQKNLGIMQETPWGTWEMMSPINTGQDLGYDQSTNMWFVTPNEPLIVGDESETYHGKGGMTSTNKLPITLTEVPLRAMYGYKFGDVNQDGFLNILDIVATVNHILGQNQLSEEGRIIADANQDGFLNILDITLLVNQSLHGPSSEYGQGD